MSERLPYEEHLNNSWQDMPLPDENLAWEDMKRRLEQEDEKRPVAWWRKGCALWGLLLLLLAITGWFIYSAYNKNSDADQIVTQTPESLSNGDSNRSEIPSIKRESGISNKNQSDTGTINVLPKEITGSQETNSQQKTSIGGGAKVEATVKVPRSGRKAKTVQVEKVPHLINNKNRDIAELQPGPVKQEVIKALS